MTVADRTEDDISNFAHQHLPREWSWRGWDPVGARCHMRVNAGKHRAIIRAKQIRLLCLTELNGGLQQETSCGEKEDALKMQ